jgi:hypothetical protein
MCWRCYGHCRHTQAARTMIFTVTRNPSRSVIGCNLPSGVERVCHASGRFGRAGAGWLGSICDYSSKRWRSHAGIARPRAFLKGERCW